MQENIYGEKKGDAMEEDVSVKFEFERVVPDKMFIDEKNDNKYKLGDST